MIRRAALLFVVSGCVEAQEPAPDEQVPPEASDAGAGAGACEVGTGEEEFVPLADGDEVTIVAGPQGGYHVSTSVRARGFDPATLSVRVTVRLSDTDAYLGPLVRARRLQPASDGWIEQVGIRSFVDDPEDARGREIVVRVDVEGDDGTAGADERRVVAR